MSSAPKYGEIKCQAVYKSGEKKGQQCKNGAYYKSNGGYYCGSHSFKDSRVKLEKMTMKEKAEIKENALSTMLSMAKEHRNPHGKGKIELFRIRGMYHKPEITPGWINIYPNFKSGWQGIGINLPKLSPMTMGPIHHNQKGLPSCKLLENFHQGSKKFRNESIKEFEENRLKYFNDTEPHRHKFKGDDENPNIPEYFVYNDNHLGYVESRQFYCNFYERIALTLEEYQLIVKLYNNGYNLRICGPDAYPIETMIEEEYLNPRVPFGHERVLYTMIVFDISEYPWRKHKTFEF